MFIHIFILSFLYTVNAKFFLGNFNSINLSNDLKSNIQEKWFIQNLDHFQPQDTRTWKQRYFSDCKHYQGNGPLFLEIGGEGPINSEKFLMSNMADNLAKKFEACSFQLEHRFYGKSQPFGNWSVENLQYLTSEQALADLANFIETISLSEHEFQNSKWIIFGGSYAGNLAAWMRLKYPHLVTGSISSSAPVQAKLDFVEYMEVVGESLGNECSSKVKSAMIEVKNAMKTPEGVKKLKELFNVCDFDVKDRKTVQNFYSNIVDSFAGVVQYNEDNRGGKRSNVTIKTICKVMLDENIKNGLVKLSNIKKIIKKQNEKCEDVSYIQSVKELRNITIDFGQSSRQWMYQTCNEFGYYQTTTSSKQPFTNLFDIDFYTDMCVDVYGPKFNIDYIKKAIVRTNMIYGSKNLNADRILLLNGSIDPWHALGLTNYQYLNTTSIYIKGTAHCADMYPKSESDLPGLKKARNVIEKQIEFFLNE